MKKLNIPAVDHQNSSVWIWRCPPENTSDPSSPFRWWCGSRWKTPVCQTGVDGNFVDYTSGHFLGTAFSSSTSFQSATLPTPTPFPDDEKEAVGPSSTAKDITPIDLASATTTSATAQSQPHQQSGLPSANSIATPNQASTNSAASAQSSPRSSNPSTAIGIGIGVPLGIAVTGLLTFLFIREKRLKRHKTKPVGSTGVGEGGASRVVGGPMPELHDRQRPFEVGGNGVSELVGTAAQIVPKF